MRAIYAEVSLRQDRFCDEHLPNDTERNECKLVREGPVSLLSSAAVILSEYGLAALLSRQLIILGAIMRR